MLLPPATSVAAPTSAQHTMQSIKKYPLSSDAQGVVEIRMPKHCEVLGVSDKGFHGIIVRGDHDPERLVPKKFVVVPEGGDAALAASHLYLGDLYYLGFRHPRIHYVFEWIEPHKMSDYLGARSR